MKRKNEIYSVKEDLVNITYDEEKIESHHKSDLLARKANYQKKIEDIDFLLGKFA